MKNEEIIQYYDYLMQLAISKGNSQTDAEDLAGDTMLAAFTYMSSGKTIEYPKTWLANTLCHKHNDRLRKKYRMPVIVCLEEGVNILEEENPEEDIPEEAAQVRKELNHLAYVTREVLIRYYYGNQSVEAIARELDIPEGTVKSRLYTGRSQMKKGLETMEKKDNYLPGKLYLSFGGADGLNGEPMSLVEGDLIAQNLLMLAYDRPLSISELSRAIGIPAAYIEPIVEKLVAGELMVQTAGGKVYTDFIITRPQDAIRGFKPQLAFAHKHFETIWSIIEKMSCNIAKLDDVERMSEREKLILDRYAVLKALQDFLLFGTEKIKAPDFPKRNDGGRWFANAVAIDAGYNESDYREASEYAIHGGHRSSRKVLPEEAKSIYFYEFDTTLWDSPHRYGNVPELYFKHIIPLLWYIYNSDSLENTDIPNEFIACMPMFEEVGLLGYAEGKPYVKIPVIKKECYDEIRKYIQSATEEIKAAIGEEFAAFITTMRTPVPKHLTSVPELFRYIDATKYFVMAIVREAYEKGMHLTHVKDCCPPVVLVYEE